MSNALYLGDCVEALSSLPSGIGDLFYVDPPFFSNRNYFANAGKPNQRKIFTDCWVGGLDEYCQWMESLLVQCRRVIKESGSMYLHCDQHASHYVKVLLDKIFGYENFRNEIIWKRQNAHNDWSQGARHFGRIHDVLFFYSASEDYAWNPVFVPYDEHYVERTYRHLENATGRYYALGDLSGPGGASKGNPRFTFLGATRNWRYSQEKMQKLLEAGRIVQTSQDTVPKLKRYLDEMNGTQVQDMWDDIKPVNRGGEKLGYPTQKPCRLLERIISASSNRGDVLIDPLFGSGTSLLTASKLGRRWIGIDSSTYACNLTRRRLERAGVEPVIVQNLDQQVSTQAIDTVRQLSRTRAQ